MIVLISGKQGSGKTTLVKNAARALHAKHVSNIRIKFADPIYQIHDYVWLNVMPEYGRTLDKEKDGRLMQLIGTEWGRNTLGVNIWADLCFHRASQFDKSGMVVLIDDCRFQNEFDRFPNALRVRLECGREERKRRCSDWRETEDHPSETDLDLYAKAGKFDYYLDTENRTKDANLQILLTLIEDVRKGAANEQRI